MSGVPVIKKMCLVCDKEVDVDDAGRESGSIQPAYNATVWRTWGNYGSTLFDPMLGDVYLEAVVCDNCLKAKKSQMELIRVRKRTEVVERKEPEFI